MRKIKAQPLTKEAFAEYGEYYDLMDLKGHNLGAFYHDHVLFPTTMGMSVGFSGMAVTRPEKIVIEKAEYHNRSCEAILPIDGDIIINVAPPSKVPVPELTEAFIVPKGTVVKFNIGVWHIGPKALKAGETVHLFYALAERTYLNDCVVVEYDENDRVEIEA